jgi:hypothetical protein
LEATERHFFAADSQLLIVVKARPADAGRYRQINFLNKKNSNYQILSKNYKIIIKKIKKIPSIERVKFSRQHC